MHHWSTRIAAIISSLGFAASAWAQGQAKAPDLAKDPTLYVVGYAHLDTQWRWTYPQTIREFLYNTLHDNFALLEKHPLYTFNFTGSRRYQFFKEYFPAEYEQLKTYVAAGRWIPCGSSVDENDCNSPSGESLVRQVLYGNSFFQRELGRTSTEYMLPDCFGFPAALPSVLAHCGIQGFSTQKLTWNSVVGIPFKVGVWEGPDGRGVVAALDPGQYDGDVKENLATSETWLKRIEADGKLSGVFADFHYYGTGDVGGAPKESSVAMVDTSLETNGPVRVIAGPADAMFKAITPEMQSHLPRYKGELELIEHSAGSLTSQAFMKRMNRKNELLADAAEKASVAAAWLGGRAYPAQKLEAAWTLVLGSQMHDIISGTALAKGYEYAWNDELLAANLFGAVLDDAVGVVAGAMTTRTDGTPLVVFNPLSVEREDIVEAEIPLGSVAAKSVRVVGPDGRIAPAQILGTSASSARIAFLARVPSLGYSMFGARLEPGELRASNTLHADEKHLENERYVVSIDENGDVASILDKKSNRELLTAPARLGLHYENPKNWPAWNQDWTDRQLPARAFVGGPARVRVVEFGPARAAVEITREAGGSVFVQRIRLSAGGAGDRVEFDTDIAWATRERSLRAAFPLAAGNPQATYDIQLGTLERGNYHPKQYEYGFQQWFDLTDVKGDYGVTVMCDSKYGCDKPDDHTLRLTLLHTPGTRGGYEDQGTQDLGRHRVLYALEGHAGDWRTGRSAIEAARLNQPMLAFRAAQHDGPLGASFSFLHVNDDRVRAQAVKQSEHSGDVVVRVRELTGHDAKAVHIALAAPILAAREIDGQERDIGPAAVNDGELVTDVRGYGLQAFAVKLAPPATKAPESRAVPIDLAFNADVISTNEKRSDGAMDSNGAYPAEQLPTLVTCEDAVFHLGSMLDGKMNAVSCRAQEIRLPESDAGFDRLYLLAASSEGRDARSKDKNGATATSVLAREVRAECRVNGVPIAVVVPFWTGFVGQWDHRLWQGETPVLAYGWSNGLAGLDPGFVEREPVAWFATHHHTSAGDAPYEYSYLYKIAVDLPPGAKTFTLPNDERIKVFAATVVSSPAGRVTPALAFSDTLDDHTQDSPVITPVEGSFGDAVEVRIEPRLYGRAGAIRFTLDGSQPSAASIVYSGPFFLSKPATIRAAVLDSASGIGPIASGKLDVNDVTPPTVTRVRSAYGSPLIRIELSEPGDDAKLRALDFALAPNIEVRAAHRGENAREIVLELASAPDPGTAYTLNISGVKDASPAHNAMKAASFELKVSGPVFKVDDVTSAQMGTEMRDVPNLPVKSKDAWTVNMVVRTDKQPEDRTIIAGFGRCEQAVDGAARYMAKFSRGVHFWIHNRDIASRTPLELGKWQMLTATYDGKMLCLYKDAKKLGERTVELADDESRVCFAPLDPWEKTRRFEGEIRDFTIWDQALSEDAIRALKDAADKKP